MINKLIKVSSLFSIVLIFCGVLKLIIYYKAFNIDIVDFLTFSEIITSFLDDINILIIVGLILGVQTELVFQFLSKKTGEKGEKGEALIEKWLQLIYPFRYRYVVIFAVLIISMICYILLFDSVHISAAYFATFFSVQCLFYLFVKKTKEGKIEISESLFALILLVGVISSTLILAIRDIKKVRLQKYSVIIQTNEETIECSKNTNIIYLGKTDECIFLYNVIKNEGSALPIALVKKYLFY